ncbi:hypothetical protein LTR10_017598 [Elasticomyces elasticus]|uniref:Myb-like domain-containing protein n=1 Tax=Exophiala sideris TaxID=1016849 RepID=A0ABR0JP19_9EURO|nr:hypothetical protein LTR10_017598 [Elasticomyces elasticus]KAK5038244.1 hypothetical protein LTS07_001713 [Exophiala sideris]KAK5044228.1 hypothetical protein LTR13_000584 [Exophiala sideris]KAK5067728.1 hypothetical protein LTR69_001717 [Exophiala sideris]KAK5184032.1 hypothetical protein LTR44_003538 [Eurotiomycetes sp. CCFEE 6388]
MARRSRPSKRVLVRWSDDLDKGVLLAVQYACAEAGIKIPWARVAQVMGPRFTEGAITQHLAKLRNLMATTGIPVPPPLKRGMLTKTPSKVYNNASNQRNYSPITPLYPGTPEISDDHRSVYDKKTPGTQEEENTVSPGTGSPKPRAKARARAKPRRTMTDDEEEQFPEDLYDSEEGTPKKRRRTAKRKSTTAVDLNPPLTPPAQAIKVEPTEDGDNMMQDFTGPASRTRGIKRNYAITENMPTDDEGEEDGAQDAAADDVDDFEAADDPATQEELSATFDAAGIADATAAQYSDASGVHGGGASNFQMSSKWPNNVDMFGNQLNQYAAMDNGMHNNNILHGQYGYPGNNMMASSDTYANTQFGYGIAPAYANTVHPASLYSPVGPSRNNSVATGMYSSAGTSDMSRNNSVTTGMTASSFTTMSDHPFGNGMDYLAAEPESQPGGIKNEFDTSITMPPGGIKDAFGMNTDMPSDDIIWGDEFVNDIEHNA